MTFSSHSSPSFLLGAISEMLASAVFVFFAAGSAAIQPILGPGGGGVAGALFIGWVHGLVLFAMTFVTMPISGGHINPIIVIGLYVHKWVDWLIIKPRLRKGSAIQGNPGLKVLSERREIYMKKFTFWWFLGWIAAETVGSVLGSVLLLTVFGTGSTLGRPVIGAGFSVGNALAYEIIGGSLIYLVIITTITRFDELLFDPFVMGLTLAFITMLGSPISGAVINPLRHFGPTLVSNTWNPSIDWIWYVGPLLGLVSALLIFWVLYVSWWWVRLPYRVEKRSNVPTTTSSSSSGGGNRRRRIVQ